MLLLKEYWTAWTIYSLTRKCMKPLYKPLFRVRMVLGTRYMDVQNLM